MMKLKNALVAVLCMGVFAFPTLASARINIIESSEPPSVSENFYDHVNHGFLGQKVKSKYEKISAFDSMEKEVLHNVWDLMESEKIDSSNQLKIVYQQWMNREKRIEDLALIKRKVEQIENISSWQELYPYIIESGYLFDHKLGVIDFSGKEDLRRELIEYNKENGNLKAVIQITVPEVLRKIRYMEYGDEERTNTRCELLVKAYKKLGFGERMSESLCSSYRNFMYKVTSSLNGEKSAETAANHEFIRFQMSDYLEKNGLNDVNYIDMKVVDKLVKGYNSCTLNEVKAFLSAEIIDAYLELFTKDFDDDLKMFYNQYYGEVFPSEKERAAQFLRSVYPETLSAIYEMEYGNKDVTAGVKQLACDIKESYRNMIIDEWEVEDEIKTEAVRCLETIDWNIGGHEEDIAREKCNVSEENLFVLIQQLKVEKREKEKNQIKLKAQNDRFNSYIVDAGYMFGNHGISIPTAILSMYKPSMRYEEKLATIGFIIGHEISHAFPIERNAYASYNDWPPKNQGGNRYGRRIRKMGSYRNFFKEPYKNDILGEALADLGGMRVVLHMARKIPNFDYDLFFKTYARQWAIFQSEETEEMYLKLDNHPLHRERVNVTLSQFEEWTNTYNIPRDSSMYIKPRKRMLFW